eukprot:TRINITY_DN1734_c0_g1_i1.p1 TRINITY_DN1734_c0_g1~~TRINITY_DN1734_c0_g1_i1.p1  ORF type:complete len:652 (+),score=142.27 TRINITY_DN1734_c0_g1_i1:81-1958(+)
MAGATAADEPRETPPWLRNGDKVYGASSATRGDLPPVEEWPQRPLYCRWAPWHKGGPPGGECMRVNSRGFYPFDTELFQGHLHVAVRDAVEHDPRMETDPWAAGARFHGKKRRFVCTVSGRFKKEVQMDDVELGLCFERRVKPPAGLGLGIAILEKFSPGMRADLTAATEQPFLMNNLCCAGSDDLHCWEEGDPPADKFDVMNPRLLNERLNVADKKFKSMHDRTKWMMKKTKDGKTNASQLTFSPSGTYSWDFYTHTLHMDKFEGWFPLGFSHWVWDLSEYFAGQPWLIVFRLRSGEVIGALEVWHENCAKNAPPGVFRPPGQPVTFAQQQGYEESSPAPPFESPVHVGDGEPVSPPPAGRLPAAAAEVARRLSAAAAGMSPAIQRNVGEESVCLSTHDGTTFMTCAESVGSSVRDDDDPAPSASSSSSQDRAAMPQRPGSAASLDVEGQDAIVLWQGKRLHAAPASKSAWVKGGKTSVPQGVPVRTLERTPDGRWTRVVTAGGVAGWIRSKCLAPRPSTAPALTGLPSATLIASSKRLRQQCQRKARFHGPKLNPPQRLRILSMTPSWALVLVPDTGAAGWLRKEHIEVSGDDGDVEPFSGSPLIGAAASEPGAKPGRCCVVM